MIAMLLHLALVVAPAPTDATAHADRGLHAYEERRYEAAAVAFAEAYAADPLPQYAYAEANALRMAGKCAEAIPRYREFLSSGPEGKTESAAQQNLSECEASVQAERDAEAARRIAAPAPVVRSPPPSTHLATTVPDRRPIARDPWAHALTWPGVTLAGVGAGLLAEAHVRRGRADDAAHELDYRDALDGAPLLSRTGIGLLSAGTALVVGGIVRWSILAARSRSDRRK